MFDGPRFKFTTQGIPTLALGFQTLALATAIILIACSMAHAQDLSPAPIKVQSALFSKVLGFNESLSGDVTVYVLGSDDFAREFKNIVGTAIGGMKIAAIESGSDLPASPPQILYIGDASKLDAALAFTKENGILSICGDPESVKKGVSLGVGISGGKPKVLINLENSKLEGAKWKPAIMKIAVTF